MRSRVSVAAAAIVLVAGASLVVDARASASPDAGASLVLLPSRPSPRPNEGTYFLERATGGGYTYDNPQFDAHVRSDGEVTFTDKHLRLETRIFGVPLRDYRKPNGQRLSLFEAVQQALRPDPFRSGLPIGTPVCDPRAPLAVPCRSGVAPIEVVGSFDLTDEVMQLTGQGWYKYEKAKFLSATFEFRVRLAVEWRARALRETIAELPWRLDALWTGSGYTFREKRRIVCLLWSEVNVDDAPSRRAADVILAWVRRRVPSSSEHGYTSAEMAACAADGRRPFDPYGAD